MKNLFLLDGTTGPVKADIISCIETQSQPDCSIVKKFTTRDFQRYENTPTWPLDLKHQSKKDFGEANYDYSYRYLGHLYGFHRSQIDEALDESDNVFIVIRNLNLSRTIGNDYSFVNVVSVLLYADREGLKERLKSEGLNEADINTIIQRNDSTLAGYRANPDSYDEFIITNCILQDMQRHFDRLIGKYESKLRLQRNLVFVLMSFDKSQPRLDDYYAAMQRAVSKVSRGQWVCKSLKDFSKNKPIYDTVKKNIASC